MNVTEARDSDFKNAFPGIQFHRRDPNSRLSPFRMGPVASGRGLGDIDRVFFRVTKSRVENWKVHAPVELTFGLE